MNQTAGATNAYRRCSKGGKVRERDWGCWLNWCTLTGKRWPGLAMEGNVGGCVFLRVKEARSRVVGVWEVSPGEYWHLGPRMMSLRSHACDSRGPLWMCGRPRRSGVMVAGV